MLNEREITLIRVALILRLDSLKLSANYQEHKSLLAKLWTMRKGMPDPVYQDDTTYDRGYEAGARDAARGL